MRRNTTRLLLALGLSFVATVVTLALLSTPVRAANQCVAPGGAGGCHATIQAAVNAVGSGEIVRVVAGTYNENVVITKGMTLLGGYDDTTFTNRTPRSSIINGGGNSSVISVTNGAAVTIDGFTITGGDATANNGGGGGIAIRQATANVIDNLIAGNVASSDPAVSGRGGGIDVTGNVSPALISGNTILANLAYSVVLTSPTVARFGLGGGIWINTSSSAIITGNQILSNVAVRTDIPGPAFGLGGGIGGAAVTATIDGNTIQGNIANAVGGTGLGGGIGLSPVGVADVTNNSVVENTAAVSGTFVWGGGIYARVYQSLKVTDNWVALNTALVSGSDGQGGGMNLVTSSGGSAPNLTLTGNWIISNTAAVSAAGSNLFVSGGGVRIWGGGVDSDTLTMQDNHLIGNVAVEDMTTSGAGSFGRAEGGGLTVENISATLIISNEVRENTGVKSLSLNGSGGWAGRPSGGGMFIYGSDRVTLSGNHVRDNVTAVRQVVNEVGSASEGGGIALVNVGSVAVSNNMVYGNAAVITGSITSSTGEGYFPSGGGIVIGCWDRPDCNPSLTGNDISNNTVAGSIIVGGSNASGGASGGGLHTSSVPTLTVSGNQVTNNTAVATISSSVPSQGIWASGGGMSMDGYNILNDSVILEDNDIIGNLAAGTMTVSGSGASGNAEGGGLRASDITTTLIVSNAVRGNIAVDNLSVSGSGGWAGRPSGGGMFIYGSDSVTLSGNHVRDNVTAVQHAVDEVSSTSEGGGIVLDNVGTADVSHNTVAGNTAVLTGTFTSDTGELYFPNGGGIVVNCFGKQCDLSFEGNDILNNVTADRVTIGGTNASGTPLGGGLDLRSGTILLHSNVISGNIANLSGNHGAGGAIDVNSSTVVMSQNRILGNQTTQSGGGAPAVWVWEGNLTSSNDVFARNTGGAGSAAGGFNNPSSTLTFVNDTFYDNGWVGVEANMTSTVHITNTIVYSHGDGLRLNDFGSTLMGDYNLLSNTTNYAGGVVGGPNDITGQNPLFVNAAAYDFHLSKNSPAIDKGNDLVAPRVDFEGDPRPIDGDFNGTARVDIGADEFGKLVYLPVVLKNR